VAALLPKVERTIQKPRVTSEKLAVYKLFHQHRAEHRGWDQPESDGRRAYISSFVENCCPTEEWVYRVDGRLMGVGYVHRSSYGLSGIYFYYDPFFRPMSPGVLNILSLIREAQQCGLPHVYLGYYVHENQSLKYKDKYRPNEIYQNGVWVRYIS
jgi:arginine-tRNA-protein transferase